MKVSVIIPVYNAGKIFEECLLALSESDYQPFEIIIVDDCSDSRIEQPFLPVPVKIIRSEAPLGAGMARNIGVKSAQGEILLFVDSDVIIEKDTITKVVERFKQDQELSAISGFYNYRNRYNNPSSVYHMLYFESKQSYIGPKTPYVDTAVWAVKKDVFVSSGGFAVGLFSAEDLELGVKLQRLGFKLRTDKSIRVTHVKFLTFNSWVKNRILACTNMFMARLRRPRYKENTNKNSKQIFATILPRQIVSPFIAWGIIALLIIFLLTEKPIWGNLSLVFLLFYFAINISYIYFILSRRGIKGLFLLPYIFFEHLISLLAVLFACVRVLLKYPYVIYR